MSIHAVQAQSPSQRIIDLLVNMGRTVEKSLDQAIAALLHTHTHVAAGLVENVLAIQESEAAVDQAVFGALQSGAMPSSEVAHATSIVNIGKELSRLAKLAASLGRKVGQVGEHCDQEDFSRLQPLAIAVSHLCRQTLRALSHQDRVLARNAAAGPGWVVRARRRLVLGYVSLIRSSSLCAGAPASSRSCRLGASATAGGQAVGARARPLARASAVGG